MFGNDFHDSLPKPNLDFDLLTEWATNSDLRLMPQDEELLLGDEQYLDKILHILDTVSIAAPKQGVLIEALCVIVYDNSHKDNARSNNHLRMRVIEELNKRQDKLKLAERRIMDYIKDVVFPQLSYLSPNA